MALSNRLATEVKMKNALIVIDVQNDYFAGGAWPQFQAAEKRGDYI